MSVSLLVPLALVAFAINSGLAANAARLLDAKNVVELSQRTVSLILVQQEVSLSLLLNPEAIEEAARKIDAYDQNFEIRREILRLTTSPKVREILIAMEAHEANVLRPLDTKILEMLFAEPIEVTKLAYFKDVAPAARHYEELAKALGGFARREASIAEANMESLSGPALWSVAGSLAVGLAFVTLVGMLVSQDLRKRLGHLSDRLEGNAANSDGTFFAVEIEVVPEPSTGLLVKLGIIGLSGRRRHRGQLRNPWWT
jgi:hypothetical protein